jgi:hypothetical protein
MTYWNEIADTHLPLYKTDRYLEARSIREDVNTEGSVGDLLVSSDVIFVGSCDIMTLVSDKDYHWARKIHKELHSSSPFIALGVTAGGLPTIVRKLYSYIQNFGAPKIVYMTIPRFEGYEYVNKSGKCYNASSSIRTVNFSLNQGIVNEEESATWLAQLEANELIRNQHNNLYILEERFAFIETICKLHNITLRWTFNPSGPAIDALYKNLPAFENISNFMKDSFVGLPKVKDHLIDNSIGAETQLQIYDRFINPTSWDYDMFCKQASLNYEWMKENNK